MLTQQYNNLYQDMIGGTMPNAHILKNINLLSGDMEKYLNPFYGFVWANSDIVNNIFLSEKTNRNSTAKIIRSSYFEIPGSLQPIKPLFLNEHNDDMKYDLVTNRDIGKYLAIKYLCMIEKDQYEKWKKCLKVTNDVEERIIKIRNLKMETEQQQKIVSKQKESMVKMMKKLNECSTIEITFDTYDENEFLHIVNNVRDIVKNKLLRYDSSFNSAINFYIDSHWEDIKENFHTVLSIMWYKADNKQGVKDYYLGLNDILENITIPETFVTDKYDLNNFNIDNVNDYDFYEQIAYTQSKKKGDFEINNQEYAFIHDGIKPFNYADCGSSAIRTFLRLWLTEKDSENFNIQKLIDNGATENLITFFTKFNNNEAQNSKDSIEIFGQNLNARDAWVFVVSNLSSEIVYNKTCNLKDGRCIQCELKARIPNIRKTLQALLSKIDDYKTFEFDNEPNNNNGKDHLLIDDFNYFDVDENFGTMEITSSKHGTFIWTFVDGHTYMNKKIDDKIEEFENDDPESEFYLLLFSKPLYCVINQHNKFNEIFPYWYKFFSFENHQDTDKLYNKMINMSKLQDKSQLKLMLDISPELYNKITLLLLFHFKNDNDALKRITLLDGIVSKENIILYFASLFTVIIDKNNDIIALKPHRTVDIDVIFYDKHNFDLLNKLNELHLDKNIVVTFRNTNNIKKLYAHNFQSIQYVEESLVTELYINNVFQQDFYNYDDNYSERLSDYYENEQFIYYNEYRFTETISKFTNVHTLVLGSNVDIETHFLNGLKLVTLKAVEIFGKLAHLPKTLREIELNSDNTDNWSQKIDLPELQLITIHNSNFNSNYTEMKFNLKRKSKINIISDANKMDISQYLFEMQILQHDMMKNITVERYNNDHRHKLLSRRDNMTMRDEIGSKITDIQNKREKEKKIDEIIVNHLNVLMIKKAQKVKEYNAKFNNIIKYSLSHAGYLKALENLTTYEDKCNMHAEYLHDLFYQIKEFNDIAEITDIAVTYSYKDDDHAFIQLTIDGKLYNINVDDKIIIITSDNETFTITDKCKNIDKDKIVNMICKMVNIKGTHVFTPNITMAYTDYK